MIAASAHPHACASFNNFISLPPLELTSNRIYIYGIKPPLLQERSFRSQKPARQVETKEEGYDHACGHRHDR